MKWIILLSWISLEMNWIEFFPIIFRAINILSKLSNQFNQNSISKSFIKQSILQSIQWVC